MPVPLVVMIEGTPMVNAPVRLRGLLPVKVKLPFKVTALVFMVYIGMPLVLSTVVPSLMVNVPVPNALKALMLSVPAFRATPEVNKLS